MLRNIKIFSLIILLAVVSSCAPEKPVFSEVVEFDKLGWNRFNELKFDVNIKDNSFPYVFKFNTKFTDEYPNSYLKIQLEKANEDGESYVKVFSIPVKNLNGNFIEEAKDGTYSVNTILINQMYFSSPGDYQIIIEQLMPKFDTEGIESVEFIIEKRSE